MTLIDRTAYPGFSRAPQLKLGPYQLARHFHSEITGEILATINRQHITIEKLEAAIRDIINCFNLCPLPRCWGTEKRVAADGTQYDLVEENLLTEKHIRYGGFGGIAYHHASDMYILLFSYFIACGVWEAVHIIDGLMKNQSDIQPDTIHAGTQGQNLPVFALSHLLEQGVGRDAEPSAAIIDSQSIKTALVRSGERGFDGEKASCPVGAPSETKEVRQRTRPTRILRLLT